MIPLLAGALIALAAAALLEEAAAWFVGSAVESRRNGDESAAIPSARSARQARLAARFLVAAAFGALVAGAVRRDDAALAAGTALLAVAWTLATAALAGVRRRSPWSLAGRLVYRPLRWLGGVLRGILLAGGRLTGFGYPASSLDRAADLDQEHLWLRGRAAWDETESMVATLHQFGEAIAEDVMVRRESIAAVSAGATVPDILAVVRAQGYSRYPVYAESPDSVVGILHVLDLLGAPSERTAQELARSPLFIPSTKPVGTLLRQLQTSYNQMAVVVDEYGGTAGLVTVEDLVEELVGEIEDELDENPPRIRRLGPETFWVDSAVTIDEVNEALELALEEGEYDTVAGLILERLEHVPRAGEGIREDGVWIEVLAAEPHRIQSLKLVLPGRGTRPEVTR